MRSGWEVWYANVVPCDIGAEMGGIAKRVMKACRQPGTGSERRRPTLNGGSWSDKLRWRRGKPKDMVMIGMWDKQRVNQLPWLEDQAAFHFGARRCFGFAGSTRLKTIPIAGSLLWSLLYRGEF